VSPAYMTWQRSGDLIIMVILGGGSPLGAIIGAIAYLLAEEWLSALIENWQVVFGPLLVLLVLFGRGGLPGIAAQLTARLAGPHKASVRG
jgi:branched-chain amino acid transport system permease protein